MTRVIVTGGAGFIGKEIVKKLLKKGYEVIVADNLSKSKFHQKEEFIPKEKKGNYQFLNADLTDSKSTNKLFKKIDVCINLAAKIGGIGYFHKVPGEIISENNKIYSSTFESAAKNNLKRMIFVSSSMVFESASSFPSKESDIGKMPPPSSAYGFSKLTGAYYFRAFWEQYKLPYSICRPFNAYGINEYLGKEVGDAHVIPDIVNKILTKQYPLKLLGDGNQIRCFTHVSDLADGIIAVMESRKAINDDFNIADPTPIKMVDLARLIWKMMGVKRPLTIRYVEGFKYDVKVRMPDVSKTQTLIGWRSKIKLNDGLIETINWLKSNSND